MPTTEHNALPYPTLADEPNVPEDIAALATAAADALEERVALALAIAKGDLLVASGAGVFARLAAGSNGKVLTAASGETSGLKWDTALPAVAAWIAADLLDGWSNTGGDYAPAGYYKDPFGVVHLRGVVGGGTGAIFELPAGYRPAYKEVQGAALTILITTAGSVTSSGGGLGTLDGINFRAA